MCGIFVKPLSPSLCSIVLEAAEETLKWITQHIVFIIIMVYYNFQPVCIPLSRIQQFVDLTQLTEEFGGTWTYNHNQWMQNRMVSKK